MGDDHLVRSSKLSPELLSDGDGTMPSACTAERDRQISLPLARMLRKREVQERPKAGKKFLRLGLF